MAKLSDLVNPVEASASVPAVLARRDEEMLLRPWGFIDTSKVNADTFIAELRGLVEREFHVETVLVEKPAPGIGITEEIANDLARKCGVVVACFGD